LLAISNKDYNFVATALAENHDLTTDRKSLTWYWRNWVKKYDYGICQISEHYHPTIFNDERFFTDWEWQAEQCRILYKGGTRFYWFDHRHKFLSYLKTNF
jgi:hypothetical protein